MYIYICCMRFAKPIEAAGGFVGQRLGALRICISRVLRGPQQGPLWSHGEFLELLGACLGSPSGFSEWVLGAP